MDRRDFFSISATAAAASFASGMSGTQMADAMEDRATADLEAAVAARTRVTPSVCDVGNPGPYDWEGKHPFLEGDDPRLAKMPATPTIVDFFERRFKVSRLGYSHVLQSALLAQKKGLPEKTVLACLLHDIGMNLYRTDHGYWAASLIAPYVDDEVTWAVKHHQALRFFADEAAGYKYPESYRRNFGVDYKPEPYIVAAAEQARKHKWYMTARHITLNDFYAFDPNVVVTLEPFVELLGRHFKTPKAGLGFDDSPSAHMWRTLIWPNNFL